MRAAGGVVVSVVDGSGERSMLTDRGPCPQLRADEIDVDWLRDCDVLHVSGYAMLGDPIAAGGCYGRPARRGRRAPGSASTSHRPEASPTSELTGCSHGSSELAPDVVFAGERRARRRSDASRPPRRSSSSTALAA